MKFKNLPEEKVAKPRAKKAKKEKETVEETTAEETKTEVTGASKPFKSPKLDSKLFAEASAILQAAAATFMKPGETEGETVDPVVEPFKAQDAADEEQIVAQLEGRYIQNFVYEYCGCKQCPKPPHYKIGQCPQRIRDLSWYGIQEASREMRINLDKGIAHITVDETGVILSKYETQPGPGVIIQTSPSYISVTVAAYLPDETRRVGYVSVPRMVYPRNGSPYKNVFAEQLAVSKAQRNALRQLLPRTLIQTWIDKFLEEGKVEVLNPPKALPPGPTMDAEIIQPKKPIKRSEATAVDKAPVERAPTPEPGKASPKGLLFDQTISALHQALVKKGVTDIPAVVLHQAIPGVKEAQQAVRGVMGNRIDSFRTWINDLLATQGLPVLTSVE